MASKSRSNSHLRCYCHISSINNIVIKPFTEPTWAWFLHSVEIWQDLIGSSAEIAQRFVEVHGNGSDCIQDIPMTSDAGRHQKCYDYFTDKSKQKRGLTAKQKHEAKLKEDLTKGRCNWRYLFSHDECRVEKEYSISLLSPLHQHSSFWPATLGLV